MGNKISRRSVLKASGLALGGVAVGGALTGCPPQGEDLEIFPLQEPLAADEMRITFLGTSVVPRIDQQCNSVFVETGSGDSFVFDCGSGVSSKYNAMQIQYSRMDKIFLTHLHGDHTSDIITIYCFGPSVDRKVPLKVWGPSSDDDTPELGTSAFCDNLYRMMAWHRLSFSFLRTGLKPSFPGELCDGFDIVATELPYRTVGGIAYENAETGVTVKHFPVVHARNGSIGYKLEWNGLSMVFTGDTKPNDFVLEQAQNVDVLIHEMVVPPDVWASKNTGLSEGDPGWEQALQTATDIQNSSHTPQKALGYIFSQTTPRLGVATHFQADPETIESAMADIRTWYNGPVAIATDLLVINVSATEIRQRRAVVDPLAWYPPNPRVYPPAQLADPMFPTAFAQLSEDLLSHEIPEDVYDPPAS